MAGSGPRGRRPVRLLRRPAGDVWHGAWRKAAADAGTDAWTTFRRRARRMHGR